MKKLVLTYVAILISLHIFLASVDSQGTYVVERELWRANQEFTKIARSPEAVPVRQFDFLIKRYEKIIAVHPRSQLIQAAYLHIGDVYILQKNYETARQKFQETKAHYQNDKEFLAELDGRVGKTYELEGNWPQAHATYKAIWETYPDTSMGLKLPVYIAQYYGRQKNTAGMVEAYAEANMHFRKLADAHPDSIIGFQSLRALASCYAEQAKWQDAINTLEEVLVKHSDRQYATPQNIDEVVKMINVIAAFKLENYDAATDVYKRFIAQFPNSHLSEYLKQHISAFDQLKQKGIKISNKKE